MGHTPIVVTPLGMGHTPIVVTPLGMGHTPVLLTPLGMGHTHIVQQLCNSLWQLTLARMTAHGPGFWADAPSTPHK